MGYLWSPLVMFAGGRVQDQLRNVRKIQATQCALAAINSEGGVVTWGLRQLGGDNSEVSDQLRNLMGDFRFFLIFHP